MSTLTEIEAAVDRLPPTQQRALLDLLSTKLTSSPGLEESGAKVSHSVLDIPTIDVGQILIPFSSEDDLLGEMIDNRA